MIFPTVVPRRRYVIDDPLAEGMDAKGDERLIAEEPEGVDTVFGAGGGAGGARWGDYGDGPLQIGGANGEDAP